MLMRLLPPRADKDYRGYKTALWIFGLIVLWKAVIALAVIFNGHEAAANADGIPLNMFSPAGAQAFLSMDAAWGLESFMLCAISAIVLWRYRSLVPFMLVILLVEQVLRKAIFYFIPIPGVAAAAGTPINLALLAVIIIGLALSLTSTQ